MKKKTDIVTRILYILIIISFVILISSCVLQVFTRFVLNSSLSWTEELARYSFIWANLLGAVLCAKNKSNATVSIITDNVSQNTKEKLDTITSVITIIISIIILIYGTKVAWAVRTQLSPALRISMLFVYGAAPVFALLLLFYSINDILKKGIEKRR